MNEFLYPHAEKNGMLSMHLAECFVCKQANVQNLKQGIGCQKGNDEVMAHSNFLTRKNHYGQRD
jgi:hypothetical protein